MGAMLGPALLPGNRVRGLRNGDEIFPAMLAAIRSATRSINFESYIYWSGQTGRDFADALAERARAGVKCHVLIDWVGSEKISEELLGEMKQAGVEIRRYNPPHWYKLARLNNRTHRKILVVDGRTGFTGGVGIADLWSGHAQDPQHWRDSHFQVDGPAVAQMQSAFDDNWSEVTGEVLHGEAYFPALAPVGPQLAQMFISSPGGGGESMQLMYLLSIASAAKNIRIANAYFVPDEATVATLLAALKRGVKVQIIVPGPVIDSQLVRSASKGRWGPLLRAGAEISEYRPTMFHCKVMIVDDLWTSVGSTNFDNRSFAINDEANLNIYDRDFARQQVAVFGDDLAHSRRVTLEEWEHRPWRERAMEMIASPVGEQL
jgi:cardiolipin synthase